MLVSNVLIVIAVLVLINSQSTTRQFTGLSYGRPFLTNERDK